MELFWQSLRTRWRAILGFSAGNIVLMIWIASAFPILRDSDAFTGFIENFPPQILALLAIAVASLPMFHALDAVEAAAHRFLVHPDLLASPDADVAALLVALTTDEMFRMPAIRLSEAHAASGGAFRGAAAGIQEQSECKTNTKHMGSTPAQPKTQFFFQAQVQAQALDMKTCSCHLRPLPPTHRPSPTKGLPS